MKTILTGLALLFLAVSVVVLTSGCELFTASPGDNQDNTGAGNGTTDADGTEDGNDTGTGGDADTDGTAGAADTPTGGLIADHTAASAFDALPAQYVDTAQSRFHIFYGHTSHGSQVITGLDMVAATHAGYPAAAGLDITEYDGDLGTQGDLAWVDVTRNALAEPGNHINLVLWSWCGGMSQNTPEGTDAYLAAMNRLAGDYPGVTFIYMTGHLDGGGRSGDLYRGNNQIRDYCAAHDKILFDFADIESYDPAGDYYPDGSDACEWCATWCASHTCPSCVECAHSQCFNCYQKGRVFWWLLARLAGWPG